jgi:hypothetical protein
MVQLERSVRDENRERLLLNDCNADGMRGQRVLPLDQIACRIPHDIYKLTSPRKFVLQIPNF